MLPLIAHKGKHFFSICVQNLQFVFKMTCFELLTKEMTKLTFVCSYKKLATNLELGILTKSLRSESLRIV